ncbi:MAG: cobalt-precorrin-6A reductase [Rhodospirillaceae bacterium]
MSEPTRLLLLGGTTESLALAECLATDARFEVITSLAGRTVAHRLPPGTVRVGGFGGAEGMAAYLKSERIGVVIDATHPFAAKISVNTAAACDRTGIPRLQLLRPAWTPQTGDRWLPVPDITAAAAALPGLGDTVFLAIGRQELAPFAAVRGVRFILRMIELPAEPLPFTDSAVILARGPFRPEDETALFTQHAVKVLVSKNSGGEATAAKLSAARVLGFPVVMIERPPHPPGPRAATVDEALTWLQT